MLVCHLVGTVFKVFQDRAPVVCGVGIVLFTVWMKSRRDLVFVVRRQTKLTDLAARFVFERNNAALQSQIERNWNMSQTGMKNMMELIKS